jgi:hypothetical protein
VVHQVKALAILLTMVLASLLYGQDPPKTDPAKADTTKPDAPAKPASATGIAENQTKSFDVKFVDPEQFRALFSSRSFVMEANRDLKVLTVHGPPAFLKEVEDAIKRFDVPPLPPANVQIVVYLLTTAEQAPAGVALPTELAAMSKEFGSKPPKLADIQVLRVREGQTGQVVGPATKPDAASLSRVWLQTALVTPGLKGEMVSLYGLRIWMSVPAEPGATNTQLKADPDVAADVDIPPNQAVMVSKVGVDKPVMVVVRATVIR